MNKRNILVRHLRKYDGTPFATIVAIGPNKIGISICSSQDRFSKKKGVEMALNSAHNAVYPKIPKRMVLVRYDDSEDYGYIEISTLINEAINFMKARANKYFMKNKKSVSI